MNYSKVRLRILSKNYSTLKSIIIVIVVWYNLELSGY